jgi:hypothetical protein
MQFYIQSCDNFRRKIRVTNLQKFIESQRGRAKMQNGETTGISRRPLFEAIGKGAEDVDNLADGDGETQKPVEEIESMCINCEENVFHSYLLP